MEKVGFRRDLMQAGKRPTGAWGEGSRQEEQQREKEGESCRHLNGQAGQKSVKGFKEGSNVISATS